MRIQNVGIIGQGFVGTALASAFSKHYKVHTYDKFQEELSTKKISLIYLGCVKSFLFVCQHQ